MPARRKNFTNRFNPTPRARSQRKKIKKSLGPDFLDPSDLGYGYLKDTYEPKCYLCDLQVSSGRSDKHLTCKKCNIKVHRRCLIPDDTENLNIPEEDWLCEKCASECSLCKLTNETEPSLPCTICNTSYHYICLESYPGHPEPKEPNLWKCKGCLDIANKKRPYLKQEPVKENTSSNISNAQLVRTNLTNGKSHTLLAPNLHHTDKIRQPSIDDSMIDNLPPIEFSDNEAGEINFINEIEPSKAEVADYHAYVSNRLAQMVKNLDMDPDPQNWTTDDVAAYVKEIGFPDQAPLFKEQLIDGSSLLLLRRVDVVKGLSMKLGPALKIYAHINQLQEIDIVPAFNSLQSSQSDNLNHN